MSYNSEKKFTEIPPDGETEYKLKFNDGKVINVTEHHFLLSGFLIDSDGGATSEPLPVNDFSSKAFELIHKITHMIKTKDERLYLQYLNQGKVKFPSIY